MEVWKNDWQAENSFWERFYSPGTVFSASLVYLEKKICIIQPIISPMYIFST